VIDNAYVVFRATAGRSSRSRQIIEARECLTTGSRYAQRVSSKFGRKDIPGIYPGQRVCEVSGS
jgi:hypothetical protein